MIAWNLWNPQPRFQRDDLILLDVPVRHIACQPQYRCRLEKNATQMTRMQPRRFAAILWQLTETPLVEGLPVVAPPGALQTLRMQSASKTNGAVED